MQTLKNMANFFHRQLILKNNKEKKASEKHRKIFEICKKCLRIVNSEGRQFPERSSLPFMVKIVLKIQSFTVKGIESNRNRALLVNVRNHIFCIKTRIFTAYKFDGNEHVCFLVTNSMEIQL